VLFTYVLMAFTYVAYGFLHVYSWLLTYMLIGERSHLGHIPRNPQGPRAIRGAGVKALKLAKLIRANPNQLPDLQKYCRLL